MPGYGFSLTDISPGKDRIYDSVLLQDNAGQRKPVFWHTLHSVAHSHKNFNLMI